MGLAAALTLLAVPAWAREDCAAGRKALAAAFAAKVPAAVAKAVRASLADPFCPGEIQQSLERAGALGLAKMAEGLPAAEQEARLEEALQLAPSVPPWQVLARLGRIAYGGRNYALAQARFEAALNDIEDAWANPDPPPAEVIETIHALADQARSLAPKPNPSPPNRRGQPGGLEMGFVRGFAISRAPLPVRFVYGEATFTPEGREDAAFLREHLARQGNPPVTLVGHTDPKGPAGDEDAFNCALSWKRVRALEAYLKAQGYRSPITVAGMGLRQPRPILEGEGLTLEERHQLQRRVEYFRTDENPETRHACPPP